MMIRPEWLAFDPNQNPNPSIHPVPSTCLDYWFIVCCYFFFFFVFFYIYFWGLCRTGKREIVTDTQNGQQHRKCISRSHADTFWSARFTISETESPIFWCSDCCCHQFNNKGEPTRTQTKQKTFIARLDPERSHNLFVPPTQPNQPSLDETLDSPPRLPLSQATVRKILFRSSGFWFNTKNTANKQPHLATSRRLENILMMRRLRRRRCNWKPTQKNIWKKSKKKRNKWKTKRFLTSFRRPFFFFRFSRAAVLNFVRGLIRKTFVRLISRAGSWELWAVSWKLGKLASRDHFQIEVEYVCDDVSPLYGSSQKGFNSRALGRISGSEAGACQ